MPSKKAPSSDPGPIKYAWIFFAIVAYPAMAAGLFFLVANTVFWTQAEKATGTIEGWEYMEDTSITRTGVSVDRARANVVSFDTPDGEEHVFVTEWGSEIAVYDTGDTVTVLYDRQDPSRAKIRGFISLYSGPLMTIVLGAAMWIASIFAKFFAE